MILRLSAPDGSLRQRAAPAQGFHALFSFRRARSVSAPNPYRARWYNSPDIVYAKDATVGLAATRTSAISMRGASMPDRIESNGSADSAELIIVTGHYGCGKTNLSLNLAAQMRQDGCGAVALVDLDVGNPYFRSSENTALLSMLGVESVAPVFANTTLDTPSLSPAVSGSITRAQRGEARVIIDVGGDPEGATTLGRFADQIAQAPYRMLYVVNRQRLMTQTPEEALELMHEIEHVSHLRVTDIVDNTHLKWDTTPELVAESVPYAHAVARATALPLSLVTVPTAQRERAAALLDVADAQLLFPCEVYVRTPWESGRVIE